MCVALGMLWSPSAGGQFLPYPRMLTHVAESVIKCVIARGTHLLEMTDSEDLSLALALITKNEARHQAHSAGRISHIRQHCG